MKKRIASSYKKACDKMPKELEKDITKAIRDYLNFKGVWHFKVMQGLGCTPGIPDIIGIYNGWFLGIEVKTARGKLSENQVRVRDEIVAAGGLYILARNVDDVTGIIKNQESQRKERSENET